MFSFGSSVLLTCSHPSCDPQQHPEGDLPAVPPNAEPMAVMDQGGRGAATASRSPTGQHGEQGQRLGWQPSATGTYQQKVLLFRKQRAEGGT